MKKQWKALGASGLFLALATIAFAAGGFDRLRDSVKVGTGASTNKTVEFDMGLGTANPKIRANSSPVGLQFANDGVNFQGFGTGSGGSSGVNVLANSGFELATSTWTNAGSGTFTTTTTAANVGYGTTSGVWTPAVNGDTLTSDQQTIPTGLYNKSCVGSISYKGGSSAITIQAIDGSSNVLGSFALNGSATNYVDVWFQFVCPSSGTMAFRLIASGSASSIYLDNAFLGTKDVITGPALGDWVSYTPVTPTNLGSGSGTSVAYWRRSGDSMEIWYKFTKDSSAGSGSAGVVFALPTGYSVDTTKTVDVSNVGFGNFSQTSSGDEQLEVILRATSGGFTVRNGSGGDITGTNLVANSIVTFTAKVPIQNWSSNVYLGPNANEEYWCYNGSTSVNDPNGCAIAQPALGTQGSHTITPTRPPSALDNWVLEFDMGSAAANGGVATRWEAAQNTFPLYDQASNEYGAYLNFNAATSFAVVFGKGGYSAYGNGTYGSNGAAWSGVSTWKYRVRRYSKPSMVSGFSLASTGSAGLLNYYDEGSFVASCSGPFASTQSVTVKYIRVGKMVSIQLPNTTAAPAASGQTSTTCSGLPTSLIPNNEQQGPTDSAVSGGSTRTAPMLYNVRTTGNLSLFMDFNTALTWATSGNNGWSQATITYFLNN